VGVTAREHTLADWPGGRIILGRPPEQVSRAEWKIEELLKLHDLSPERGDANGADGGLPRALDLGASPGGWARILRLRGYEVWAVDPGALHPLVAADPGVHHIATTAGRFLGAGTEPGEPTGAGNAGVTFDLVVNDMRMTAGQSSRVMVDAATRLRPGGRAVMTLKVSTRGTMGVIERALATLSREYTPELVRQLYHNKNEVTVVARRR
jgi:23S rRNA (cytidine2498-2'-O)-methyltransferase